MSFWTEFRDVAKIVVGVVAAFYGYYGVLLTAVSDVYGRDQRRQLRKQARAEFLKSLKDRYQMVRSATESRKSIYGRARVSGPIVYAQSTGAKKEFLHLVIALAGRECDAIEGVLFNDVLLPAEDGSGFIQSGEYARTDILDVSDTFSGTSKTLAFTPSSIVVVTRVTGSGDGSSSVILNSPADYTLAGATLTIPGGGAGVIEYQRTQVTPRVRIKKFLGTTTQAASSDLITESGGVKWTSAHQLKGICYLYVRLEYDQNIFGQSGLPNVSAIVRGNKLYDPRLDSTAGGSGAHRIATPSTWAWSENSALATSDFLRDAQFGMVAAAAETPAAETIDAANSCDDAILIYNAGTVTVTNGSPNVSGGSNWLSRARPGMLFVSFDLATYVVKSVTSNTALVLTTNYAGTTQAAAGYTLSERRYTCNGVLDSGDAARNNLDRITESMAGSVTWVQGRWRIRAGIHFSSTLTITESMLGDRSPVISPRSPRQELFNRVTATYAEPEKLYTEMQAPPVTNATYLSDDGGLELPVELALDMVTGGVRAQRLSKIHFEVQRQALTVRLNTNLSAYDTAPGDVVALTLARYGWSSKLFVILERKFDLATRQIDFVLRETASGVWDWALGAETAIDLTPNTDLPSPFTLPPALTGMAVVSGTAQLMRLPDGTILTRALITWSASTDAFVFNGGRIEVRWKTDAAADWTVEPSVPGDSTSAVIGPMDDLRVTIAQIRPVNARGRFGAWTSVAFVSVGKSAAPANVSGLTSTTVQGGADIRWTNNAEVDYGTTVLRVGASWAAGVQIFNAKADSFQWRSPPGSFTVWAKHLDTSGNQSTNAVSVAVLLGVGGAEGGYVNSDPTLARPGEWFMDNVATDAPIHQIGFSDTPGVLNAWWKVDGRRAYVYSARFPVSSLKTYLIESTLYMLAANTTTHYLGVAFYDGNGALLDGTNYPMTGWPATGSFHYFGLTGTNQGIGAKRYLFDFGAQGTGKIPPLAATARVLILGSYNDQSGAGWGWGGAQVREIAETATIAPEAATSTVFVSANAPTVTGNTSSATFGGTIGLMCQATWTNNTGNAVVVECTVDNGGSRSSAAGGAFLFNGAGTSAGAVGGTNNGDLLLATNSTDVTTAPGRRVSSYLVSVPNGSTCYAEAFGVVSNGQTPAAALLGNTISCRIAAIKR